MKLSSVNLLLIPLLQTKHQCFSNGSVFTFPSDSLCSKVALIEFYGSSIWEKNQADRKVLQAERNYEIHNFERILQLNQKSGTAQKMVTNIHGITKINKGSNRFEPAQKVPAPKMKIADQNNKQSPAVKNFFVAANLFF